MARTPSPKSTQKQPAWLSLDEWTAKAANGDLPHDAAIRATFDTEIKSEGDDSRRMSFVISTANADRDRDCVMPKGIQIKNFLKNPVVLFAHDYRSLPVAKAISVKADDSRVTAEAEFATADMNPMAESVYRMLKAGFLKATSIGFRPLKYAINEERRGYDFEECELLEFSIVPVPANAEALALAASANGEAIDLAPVKAWLEAVEKAQTKAEEPTGPSLEVKVNADELTAAIAKFEAVAERIEKALAVQKDPPQPAICPQPPAKTDAKDEDDGEIRLALELDDDDLVFRFEDDTDPDVMAIDVDEMRSELRTLFAQEFAAPLLQVADGAVARVLAEARGQVV